MLPDWPQLKGLLADAALHSMFRTLDQKDPLLAKIRRVVYHEGNSSSNQDEQGDVHKGEFFRFTGEATLKDEDVPSSDAMAAQRRLNDIGGQMQAQMARTFVKTIEQVTAKTGNVVNAKGGITFELVLEMLEKLQVDFDDKGQPVGLDLVTSPDAYEDFVKVFKEASSRPDYRKQLDDVMRKKHEEWLARESHRTLVD